jgi:hypothetical protein
MANLSCTICFGALDQEGDFENGAWIRCIQCKTAVHTICYNGSELNAKQRAMWKCMLCEKLGVEARPMFILFSPQLFYLTLSSCKCCFRHANNRIMKPLDSKNWVHCGCISWIPETYFGGRNMREVHGYKDIPKERWKLQCAYCIEAGAPIQCSMPHCTVPFHPLCGYDGGLKFSMDHDSDTDCPGAIRKAYCKKHR